MEESSSTGDVDTRPSILSDSVNSFSGRFENGVWFVNKHVMLPSSEQEFPLPLSVTSCETVSSAVGTSFPCFVTCTALLRPATAASLSLVFASHFFAGLAARPCEGGTMFLPLLDFFPVSFPGLPLLPIDENDAPVLFFSVEDGARANANVAVAPFLSASSFPAALTAEELRATNVASDTDVSAVAPSQPWVPFSGRT